MKEYMPEISTKSPSARSNHAGMAPQAHGDVYNDDVAGAKYK
jgi:hypothetical protein